MPILVPHMPQLEPRIPIPGRRRGMCEEIVRSWPLKQEPFAKEAEQGEADGVNTGLLLSNFDEVAIVSSGVSYLVP